MYMKSYNRVASVVLYPEPLLQFMASEFTVIVVVGASVVDIVKHHGIFDVASGVAICFSSRQLKRYPRLLV